MRIFEVVANVFRVPELRRRLLFTLAMLAVYRVGCQLPITGVHPHVDAVWGIQDLFTGGSGWGMTIFRLGITPYITASILLQLMTAVLPWLARLQNEGELGRRKIAQWTRYLTVVLALGQAWGIAGSHLLAIVTLACGSTLVMWLGEQITAKGIGNGASLLIFTNILVGLPRALGNLYTNTFVTHDWGVVQLIAVMGVMAMVVALVVLVERGERRIPVQYAKRVLGRRVLGSTATHVPIRVNSAGVMPVIFASAVLTIPQSMGRGGWLPMLKHGEPLYYVLFAVAVAVFSFVYVSIIFHPFEAADRLRRYGGFIPGTRPGRETARVFDDVLTRLTFIGAAYLVLLCLIPDLMLFGVKLQHLWRVGDWMDLHMPRFVLYGMNVNFAFGGTSLLIVVGVAMDLINQIEAQLTMRHYETFRPRSRRPA